MFKILSGVIAMILLFMVGCTGLSAPQLSDISPIPSTQPLIPADTPCAPLYRTAAPATPSPTPYYDNSLDPDSLSDFLETEKCFYRFTGRMLQKNSATINTKKEFATLSKVGVSQERLYLTFASERPLEASFFPEIAVDGHVLPVMQREDVFGSIEGGVYSTVYSGYLVRQNPYLASISLIHVQAMNSEYVFNLDWYTMEATVPESPEEEAQWLAENKKVTEQIDHAEHAFVLYDPPSIEESIEIIPEHFSIKDNTIAFDGVVNVLSPLSDRCSVSMYLEFNEDVFHPGQVHAPSDNIVSAEKGTYPIGWRWDLPFHYFDLQNNDELFVRIEVSPRESLEKMYASFVFKHIE